MSTVSSVVSRLSCAELARAGRKSVWKNCTYAAPVGDLGSQLPVASSCCGLKLVAIIQNSGRP
jgi:hypothetical protein